VHALELGWRNIAEGPEQAPIVEPVHPFEGRELDGVDVPPGLGTSDHLRLEQPDDGPCIDLLYLLF